MSSECPMSLCSAEYGAPPGNYFCTTTCTPSGKSCGTGVRCAAADQNQGFFGCVPEVCLPDGGR